jgi:hypothetical protein
LHLLVLSECSCFFSHEEAKRGSCPKRKSEVNLHFQSAVVFFHAKARRGKLHKEKIEVNFHFQSAVVFFSDEGAKRGSLNKEKV